MNFLKKLFQRTPKTFVLDDKYRVVEAFELRGVTYFQFDDAFKIPTERALRALTIYEEFRMNCDKDYLDKHVRAVELILSDPKKINLNAIVLLNNNLKERLNLTKFPDHIYKLASVIFFDKTEAPYGYDPEYNKKKIEKWKEADGVLDFFLKGPLSTLIPSLQLPADSSSMYFQIADQVDMLHRNDLQEVLSKAP